MAVASFHENIGTKIVMIKMLTLTNVLECSNGLGTSLLFMPLPEAAAVAAVCCCEAPTAVTHPLLLPLPLTTTRAVVAARPLLLPHATGAAATHSMLLPLLHPGTAAAATHPLVLLQRECGA